MKLDYGNYGILLAMDTAGFISSTVPRVLMSAAFWVQVCCTSEIMRVQGLGSRFVEYRGLSH